jgi:hypothetical protein
MPRVMETEISDAHGMRANPKRKHNTHKFLPADGTIA